jgi:alpha-tubulin suppressor-like RCC1 family protein
MLGSNLNGQLGYRDTGDIADGAGPGDVPLGAPAVEIATGGSHSCARLETGALRCWGLGESGQLGYGNTESIGDDEDPAEAGDVPLD